MNEIGTRLQFLKKILELSRELTSTVSLEPLLHKIVRAAAELTNSEMAAIMLLNEQGDELHFVAASNLVDQLVNIPVPIEHSIAGASLASSEPLIVHDASNDPRHYKMVDQLLGFETRSLLAAPLQFHERQIGVLEAENKRAGEGFTSEDVETLTGLAAQAAVAIENARLVEDLREAHALTEALRQAGAALSSTLDYNEVLDRILEQLNRVVPDVAANIMLIEQSGTVRIFRARGHERFGTAETAISFSYNIADVVSLREMQRTGKPLVIPNVERYDGWVTMPEQEWTKSYAGTPIRIRDRVIGFLNVSSATPDLFSQADAERLQAFADHAAIAIENARLYYQAQQELDERERAEQELRQHRDRLEEVVAERTTELRDANEQLQLEIGERKQAEEALRQYTLELETRNKDLDAFAHTVAHDLKAPLGAIIGFAQVLEDGYAALSGEEVRDYLDMIVDGGKKMNSIIDEILLLASVRKMASVEVRPLNMEDILNQVHRRLSRVIEEYQAEIVLPETWPTAMGYGPWVEEVWVNYLSNALKYGGRPPRVELGADRERIEGQRGVAMVRFWVRDNGAALAPEEQAQLFAPFTRLGPKNGMNYTEGHGVGLSIVQQIVEKLGGQVGVEGQEGHGNTFTFTLPSASP